MRHVQHYATPPVVLVVTQLVAKGNRHHNDDTLVKLPLNTFQTLVLGIGTNHNIYIDKNRL